MTTNHYLLVLSDARFVSGQFDSRDDADRLDQVAALWAERDLREKSWAGACVVRAFVSYRSTHGAATTLVEFTRHDLTALLTDTEAM